MMYTQSRFRLHTFRKYYAKLLLVLIALSAVSAFGAEYYFGSPWNSNDSVMAQSLTLGDSFSYDDVVDDAGNSTKWIKNDNVSVATYYANADGTYSPGEDILEYNEETKMFKAVGVSEGKIVFTNTVDTTVTYSIPFKISFRSGDTQRILADSGISNQGMISEGSDQRIYTRADLESVSSVTLSGDTSDMADIAVLSKVKTIVMTQKENVQSFTNMDLTDNIRVYVDDSSYDLYLDSSTDLWKDANPQIFVTPKVNNVSVVFNHTGGSLPDNPSTHKSLSIDAGNAVDMDELAGVSRTGYTFVGWFISHDEGSTLEDEVNKDTVFTADTKVYAKWTANGYKVVFHGISGEVLSEYALVYDNPEHTVTDEGYSIENYVMAGWSTQKNSRTVDLDFGAQMFNFADTEGAVVDYYPVCYADKFTVKYFSGTEEYETVTIKYSVDGFTPLDPDKLLSSHGQFAGWSYNGTEYTHGKTIEPLKFIIGEETTAVFYAVFDPTLYTVRFNTDGLDLLSTACGDCGVLRDLKIGEDLTLPLLDIHYCEFKGWEYTEGSWADYWNGTYGDTFRYAVSGGVGLTENVYDVTLTPVYAAHGFTAKIECGSTSSTIDFDLSGDLVINSIGNVSDCKLRGTYSFGDSSHSVPDVQITSSGIWIPLTKIKELYDSEIKRTGCSNNFFAEDSFKVKYTVHPKITLSFYVGENNETYTRTAYVGYTFKELNLSIPEPDYGYSYSTKCLYSERSGYTMYYYRVSGWYDGNEKFTTSTVISDSCQRYTAKYYAYDTDYISTASFVNTDTISGENATQWIEYFVGRALGTYKNMPKEPVNSGSSPNNNVPYHHTSKSGNDTYYWAFKGWKDSSGNIVTKNTIIYNTNQKLTSHYIQVDKTSCVAKGTELIDQNGSIVLVEDVKPGDSILAYNHYEGKFEFVPITVYTDHGSNYSTMIKLQFADGSHLDIVDEHGLFDYDLKKYVMINSTNAESYIGHRFVHVIQDGDGYSYETTVLTDAVISNESVYAYSLLTAGDINIVTNGILSIAADTDGLYNMFEITDGLAYDQELMESDLDTYGYLDYEQFAEYMTKEEFDSFGGKYLQVSIGKGLTTLEKLYGLIDKYLTGENDEVQRI